MQTTSLILFDVDGTLISTTRAGIDALAAAGRDLFGPGFRTDLTEFAGRLDPLILVDLLRDNNQPVEPATVEALRAGYRRHLPILLSDRSRCRALPGVHALLARLSAEPAVVGLLTGNYPDTGALKLRACGLDPDRFALSVWGDDSPKSPPSRDHLPVVAMERFQRANGCAVRPAEVVVVGDTPHDVRCARAHGCRSLGVATGRFTRADLLGSGADHAVDTFEDADGLCAWLFHRTTP